MPRPREYHEDRVSTAVRLPRRLHTQAQREAMARGISVNKVIEQALREYLKGRRRA